MFLFSVVNLSVCVWWARSCVSENCVWLRNRWPKIPFDWFFVLLGRSRALHHREQIFLWYFFSLAFVSSTSLGISSLTLISVCLICLNENFSGHHSHAAVHALERHTKNKSYSHRRDLCVVYTIRLTRIKLVCARRWRHNESRTTHTRNEIVSPEFEWRERTKREKERIVRTTNVYTTKKWTWRTVVGGMRDPFGRVKMNKSNGIDTI